MRPALLVVAACSGAPPQPLSNAQPAREPLEIKLTHTACFGDCPAYTLAIHADGRVDWNGEQNVAVIGPAHATIAPDQLAQISAELDRVHFFTLDNAGRPPSHCKVPGPCVVIVACTDTPHTLIEVTRGAQHHAIDNAHCSELPVDHLEVVIAHAVNTARWIGPR